MSFPTTTTTPSMFPFGVPPQIPDEINLSPPLLVRPKAVGIPPSANPFKSPHSFVEIPPWLTSAQMEEMLPMPPRLVCQNVVVTVTHTVSHCVLLAPSLPPVPCRSTILWKPQSLQYMDRPTHPSSLLSW
jgi:hypothetical protein